MLNIKIWQKVLHQLITAYTVYTVYFSLSVLLNRKQMLLLLPFMFYGIIIPASQF